MTLLDGKVAVVTGASRGIGRAIANRLEESGACVARIARTECAAEGGTGFVCDVTNEAAVAQVAAAVRARMGSPHIVVNNAGLFLLQPFELTGVDDLRAQLEVNLVGAFLVAKAFVGELVDTGGGHLVTVGSVADHAAFPGNAAYAASKYGLRGLHEVITAEYAPHGLRTTLISPGATDTAAWDPVDPDQRDDLPDRAGMLRPEDVADAVLFAVSRPPRANVDLMWLNPTGTNRS